jgi:hypothetical protein
MAYDLIQGRTARFGKIFVIKCRWVRAMSDDVVMNNLIEVIACHSRLGILSGLRQCPGSDLAGLSNSVYCFGRLWFNCMRLPRRNFRMRSSIRIVGIIWPPNMRWNLGWEGREMRTDSSWGSVNGLGARTFRMGVILAGLKGPLNSNPRNSGRSRSHGSESDWTDSCFNKAAACSVAVTKDHHN